MREVFYSLHCYPGLILPVVVILKDIEDLSPIPWSPNVFSIAIRALGPLGGEVGKKGKCLISLKNNPLWLIASPALCGVSFTIGFQPMTLNT